RQKVISNRTIRHPTACSSKNGVITVVSRKYGRKYGWRQRAPGREFRGHVPRNSSDQIRSFDDHNTEAPHSAVDTGAPDGPNFAAVPRNSPVVVPENFEAPRSGPEIPECSSLRIYSRIPRSLLVIRPVIAPARRATPQASRRWAGQRQRLASE